MIFFLVIKASLGCPKVVGRLLKKLEKEIEGRKIIVKKKILNSIYF